MGSIRRCCPTIERWIQLVQLIDSNPGEIGGQREVNLPIQFNDFIAYLIGYRHQVELILFGMGKQLTQCVQLGDIVASFLANLGETPEIGRALALLLWRTALRIVPGPAL